MTTQQIAAAQWTPYKVRTHNASEHSENRMHSDDVARKFGFKGALVPGVTVFAHMTRPLVERYGETWLAKGIADVSFAKPAYEGDLLTVNTAPAADDRSGSRLALTCVNEDGVELAKMTSELRQSTIAPDARSAIAPAPPSTERPIVTWDLMEVGKPFPAMHWAPTQADNLQWCTDVRDDLAIYREGSAPFLHPGFVLRQANHVLRNRFTLPAWIHTGSRITFHESLRVGPAYEVRAIPEEKWERKGHEMVRLYVAIRDGDKTMAEVIHSAIFRPREKA
jgi:acyl dehydratase